MQYQINAKCKVENIDGIVAKRKMERSCCRIKSLLADAQLLFHPFTDDDDDGDDDGSDDDDGDDDDDDDDDSGRAAIVNLSCFFGRARDLRMKIYQCTHVNVHY